MANIKTKVTMLKYNIIQKVRKTIKSFKYYMNWIHPIQKNKIVITSYFGKGYGDNGKYIVEELLRDGKKGEYDIVWVVSDMNAQMPDGVRKVLTRTNQAIYEEATAKIWIDNARKSECVRKRKGQYYIQAWHGDIAFKKIENDAYSALSANYVRNAINDSKMADLFVSGNAWMTEKYKSSFWYNGEVAKCGYPRRDILYRGEELTDKIKQNLNISSKAKILLYAPTFRKNNGEVDLSVYNLDWNGVLSALSKRFGGEWKGLVRLHPNISAYSKDLNIPENIIDVTGYPDMQELMLISDVCISDYSSSLFEFAVTKKPAFIFATDIELYKKDRDLYFTFDEIPFAVSESNNELISAISNFDDEKYNKEHFEFYNEKLGMYKEGNASKYIADVIRKKIHN